MRHCHTNTWEEFKVCFDLGEEALRDVVSPDILRWSRSMRIEGVPIEFGFQLFNYVVDIL